MKGYMFLFALKACTPPRLFLRTVALLGSFLSYKSVFWGRSSCRWNLVQNQVCSSKNFTCENCFRWRNAGYATSRNCFLSQGFFLSTGRKIYFRLRFRSQQNGNRTEGRHVSGTLCMSQSHVIAQPVRHIWYKQQFSAPVNIELSGAFSRDWDNICQVLRQIGSLLCLPLRLMRLAISWRLLMRPNIATSKIQIINVHTDDWMSVGCRGLLELIDNRIWCWLTKAGADIFGVHQIRSKWGRKTGWPLVFTG